jgi:DNA-binding winged helix-turn-helix (wHTH) protein/tetratricopeptide (TPR) repeat protein
MLFFIDPMEQKYNMESAGLTRNKHCYINPKLRNGFKLDDVVVLPNDGEVICNGHRCHLAPKAFELLLYLCENQDQIVSTQDLLICGWGDSKTKRSQLTHAISEIRHALKDHKECPEFIQTLPRKGYRLIAQVTPLDDSILYPNVWPHKTPFMIEPPLTKQSSNMSYSAALFKNSKIFSMSVAFFVVTWVLLQVFELVFPIFDIPEWGLKIVVLVLVIGFPLALMFTWLKEIKIKKQLLHQQAEGGRAVKRKNHFFKQLALDFSLIGVLSIAVGFIALYLIESIETEQQQAALNPSMQQELASIKLPIKHNLIAVLALKFDDNLALADINLPDYFSATFQSELIHALSQQNYYQLVSQKATNDLDSSSQIEDYAKKLGAKYLLEGRGIFMAGELSVVVNLIDTQSSLQIWSTSIKAEPTNLLLFQKTLNRQIFNALALLSKQASNKVYQVISTNDFKSYDHYIQAKSIMNAAKSEVELAQAESLFLKSLAFDPNFALASAGLCQTYLEQYLMTRQVITFDLAKNRCAALLSVAQLKQEAYVALGNLNRMSGEYVTAVNFYHRALELNAQNIDAISGEALSQHQLGKTAEAEKLLLKNIAIEPGYWKNYLTLGDFYFDLGDYPKAAMQYQRVSLLKPQYEQGFNRLGAAYFMSDQLAKASDAWQLSLKIKPNANNYSNLGSALFFQHKFVQASAFYQQAVDMRQADPILWGNLADAEKYSGKLEQALNHYTTAADLAQQQLQVNPNDINFQSALSRYQSELGVCDQALNQMQRLAQLKSSDPYLKYDLALIAMNCQQPKQAKAFIQQAVEFGYSEKLLARDIQFEKIIKNQPRSAQ